MVPRIRLPSSCSRLAALPSSSPSPSSSLFASSRRSLSTTPSHLALITYPPRPQTSHSGSPAAFAAENPVKFPKSVLDRPQPYSPLAIDPMQSVGSLYSRAGIRAPALDYQRYLLNSIGSLKENVAELSGATTLMTVLKTAEALTEGNPPTVSPLDQSRRIDKEYDFYAREGLGHEESVSSVDGNPRVYARYDSLLKVRRKLFKLSCEALNNSFFLSGLRSQSDPAHYPSLVESHVTSSFGSNSALEQTLIGFAQGMSSSGFLWLVQEVDPLPSSTASSGGTDDLAVLATYGSGTMLVRAGELVHDRSKGFMSGLTEEGLVHLESRPWWMTGENDNQNKKNSEDGSSSEPNQPPLPFGNSSSSSSLDPSPARTESSSSNLPSTDSSIARGYKRLVPLACLSMHEHAFMVDHGIWGKAEYVRAWMNNLDWELVEKRMAKEDFGGAVGGGSSAGTVRF